jgi:hypothetical protein
VLRSAVEPNEKQKPALPEWRSNKAP